MSLVERLESMTPQKIELLKKKIGKLLIDSEETAESIYSKINIIISLLEHHNIKNAADFQKKVFILMSEYLASIDHMSNKEILSNQEYDKNINNVLRNILAVSKKSKKITHNGGSSRSRSRSRTRSGSRGIIGRMTQKQLKAHWKKVQGQYKVSAHKKPSIVRGNNNNKQSLQSTELQRSSNHTNNILIFVCFALAIYNFGLGEFILESLALIVLFFIFVIIIALASNSPTPSRRSRNNTRGSLTKPVEAALLIGLMNQKLKRSRPNTKFRSL